MSRLLLPTLPSLVQLYRDTYRLTEAGRVAEAFDRVHDALDLQIDPVSRQAFRLVLGKLCEVPRFAGNVHIAESRKGTTGQHTLMVMPLIAAVGSMALGHKEASRSFNSKAWRDKSNNPVQHMMRDMCVQVLMHDLGEEIVELSSLSQRRLAGKMEEQPQLERKIAEFTMRLGYYAVLAGKGEKQQKKIFDREIDAIRSKIDTKAEYKEEIVGQTLGKKIGTCIDEASQRLHLDILPQDITGRLRIYMAAYDEPEGFSHFARFNGVVVKHCQNMQTVLHMVEHLNTDGAVPYAVAHSSEARAALWYADRKLGDIYNTANPANPLQMAVARSCAEMAYAINLGILEAPIPAMIDRLNVADRSGNIARRESSPHDTAAREQEISASRQRSITSGRRFADFSVDDLTRGQLIGAYSAAYQAVRENQDFRPTAASIVDSRELPEWLMARMLPQPPMLGAPDVTQAFTGGKASGGLVLRPPAGPRAA